MYQILMRDGTTEIAPMIALNFFMQAFNALGEERNLAQNDYPIPISFIYGENDWVHILEEGTAEEILKKNKYYYGPDCCKNGIYVS